MISFWDDCWVKEDRLVLIMELLRKIECGGIEGS